MHDVGQRCDEAAFSERSFGLEEIRSSQAAAVHAIGVNDGIGRVGLYRIEVGKRIAADGLEKDLFEEMVLDRDEALPLVEVLEAAELGAEILIHEISVIEPGPGQ